MDTASYDIFRQQVAAGALPNAQAVRLEDYVNAFDYAYPMPEAGAEVPFAVSMAVAPHPLGRDRALLRVGIQAAARPELEKLPTNLVFLVDVSGSMQSPDKLPLVQAVIRRALDELSAPDTVAIVTYASDTRVRLHATSVSERRRIENVIDGLSGGGSTYGAAGIDLAYQEAEAGRVEGGFNHVILMTDGDFNVGPSSTAELVDLIEAKRETGITLTALGFGSDNLNDGMLELVSNSGNGIYSVIIDEQHAERYAAEDLLRAATYVAQDLKIQVELNPEHVVGYRLLGYVNRAIADDDFREDVVDAGEVGSEHRVTALYELVLAGETIPTPEGAPPIDGEGLEGPADPTLTRMIAEDELAVVRLRWKTVGAAASDPAAEAFFAIPVDAPPGLDADLEWAAALAGLAELVGESPYAEAGDFARIEAMVQRLGVAGDRAELRALWPRVRAAFTGE